MSSSLTYAPLQELAVPANASSLVDTWMTKAAWIWTTEDPETWVNNSPSSRTASSTTILIAADNFFELFVNGILLHRADTGEHWRTPLLYTVPVTGDSVVYAVRAVNGDEGIPANFSGAGLRAAVRIDFTSPSPLSPPSPAEEFYTTADRNWMCSHIFGDGWEQPGFPEEKWNVAGEKQRSEAPNEQVYPPTRLNLALAMPTAGCSAQQSLIPPPPPPPCSAATAAPFPSDPSLGDSNLTHSGSGFWLSTGQFAGGLVGVILGSAMIGALISFVLVRRHYTLGKVF
ncbi:hypothetical protein NMY22_g4896 [Coprinellus aureogranulatus]|nr:hypothetical protein NMY22_g4896 [Coprinellus aureogranulatus]